MVNAVRKGRMSDITSSVTTMVMAGGEGERLYPLTQHRTKAAVPFAGNYRIIDFTLSNCLNSGLKRIQVLTQYKSDSLNRHIRWGWDVFSPELGNYIRTVPPQQRLSSHWYLGTADAVFQNIHSLDEERPEHVLLLSGDHIYRMDYRELLQYHVHRDADATVCCTRVPLGEASRLGVVGVEDGDRIVYFEEKPSDPSPAHQNADFALCSMGVYAFKTTSLVKAVIRDARTDSEHDFARNILPEMLRNERNLVACVCSDGKPVRSEYWRDIGTLDAYWRANMDFLPGSAPFDLNDPDWPMRTYPRSLPAASIRGHQEDHDCVSRCLLAGGVRVEDAAVHNSVIGPNVHVKDGSVIEDSVLMGDIVVGRNCRLRKVIVDKNNCFPDGERIGFDPEKDGRHFTISESGIVAVPQAMPLYRN